MLDVPVLSFIAVTLPLVLVPGASTAVVLRNSVAGGTRAGVITAVGVNVGSLCYGLLTAFGFAVALRRWPSAWSAVRGAGILYLTWLGVQSLRHAIRPSSSRGAIEDGVTAPAWNRSLSEGFLTNLLNPAIATFYFVVVPQFVVEGRAIASSVLILTTVHIALAATWHIVWAAAGGTMARVLSAGRPRRILEAIAGTALLAFAVKLAVG